MKICTICHKQKDNKEFNWKNREKGYQRSECRKCEHEKSSSKLKNLTPEQRRARNETTLISVRNRAERNIKWVADYLKEKSCIKCGENNIIVLEFHHRNPAVKYSTICRLAAMGRPLELIITEVEKCDILCANCHRIITAHERNYRILKFV